GVSRLSDRLTDVWVVVGRRRTLAGVYKRLILVLFATAIFPALLLGACQSGDDDDDTTPVTTRTATKPSGSTSATATTTPFVLEGGTVTPSGLQYRDEVVGTGESPRLD